MSAPAADAKSIFGKALELEPPARAAYLDEACADDPGLRARIDGLLDAHGQAGAFMRQPATAVAAGLTGAYEPVTEGPGTAIGPYKLLQQIGEGGMGAVYMAEQEQPVRRRVALKLIKPGMDSVQVVARFEAERQALALMDHPNIAKVLDAGTTATGRPYFVMELVKGVPITKFCDQQHLTPKERLELLIPVCQALQHAHQKGVIHRDLKPSNVLIALYDGRPVPKVIDFGVAKALHQRLTDRTMFTEFGQVVGTLEYMSPEQAELNQLDIDTRSDVYSLGVLLYELLTGTTPLDRKRLGKAAFDEVLRLIREEEPPKPSTRLSHSDELPSIAANRRTEPKKLGKLVRGELDWIVMRALEKDRSRRYETANGLARDLLRYLADEPVEACPPSARYRLGKFVRKHKKGLAATAAFVALLVAGVVLSTSLAVWATSAEREANRQRIAAEAAKQEAVDARGTADKQRDEARVAAYVSGIGLIQHALDENNVVRARELLAGLPTEAAGRDLRGFEWYYLSRLCNAEVRTFKGHTKGVRGVAFSPDGRRLASGSSDGTVKVWDYATGQELPAPKGHPDSVNCVAFSPDGRRLASGSSDGTVKVWDYATGQEPPAPKGHPDSVNCVAFSPDGRCLASGSTDQTVKIWDSATGKELHTLRGQAKAVWSVAFSPDGRRLASGSRDNAVKVWDAATGQDLLTLKTHSKRVHEAGGVPIVPEGRGVAFSPDGRLLAAGSADDTVTIWDGATGQELRTLVHANWVNSVAFSPDGRLLASGSADNTVRIWDAATGQELASFREHALQVDSVAFSPDGRYVASGSADATVKIWDTANSKEPFTFKGGANVVRCVAFSPDGRRLASGDENNTVKVWDSATGQELLALKGHPDSVMGVAFSPDGGRLASGSADTTVKVWDAATGRELLPLQGHTKEVWGVAFSPDGRRLASGSLDKTVKVWDTATGRELLTLKGAGVVRSVAFSPDGQCLASSGEDRTVKVWDSATGQELHTLKGHVYGIRSVAFSPDGRRIASGSMDKTVKVWDAATGQELHTLKGHAVAVNWLAFSPDGRRLASGSSDQTVKIWDTATGQELVSLKGRAGPIRRVAFSPDGRTLAAVNQDSSISLWEAVIPPEVRERRAALAAALLAQPTTPAGK
jgi:WD40 repeat protein/serine/threonine protein kinase